MELNGYLEIIPKWVEGNGLHSGCTKNGIAATFLPIFRKEEAIMQEVTVVSRLFRKFSFDRSVDGNYPARYSVSSMSSSRRCSMFM